MASSGLHPVPLLVRPLLIAGWAGGAQRPSWKRNIAGSTGFPNARRGDRPGR